MQTLDPKVLGAEETLYHSFHTDTYGIKGTTLT
jgi:hypothetical protein